MSSSEATTEIAEEAQKYVQLTKIFFCKVIECIYCNRCPNELSDLTNDKARWFGMEIPKSESLRQLAAKRSEYGWFQIDVILTDPDVVIERWILAHEPTDMNPSMTLLELNSRDLQKYTFRRFSQILRSIFSLLNALPSQTLQIAMSQLSAPNRRITAVCSHFMSLPVKTEPQTRNQIVLNIGTIITPFGKCSVTCKSVKNINDLIPQIVPHSNARISTLFSLDKPICDIDDSLWVDAPIAPGSDSEEMSFSVDLRKSCSEELCQEPTETPVTAAEFFARLDSISLHFNKNRTTDELKESLTILAKEVDSLSQDWLTTSG